MQQDGLDSSYDRVFILGDTSYGSCCVDEVAAQHLFADCIVHYGRTCLSATSKIPVVYVFGNASIDVATCVDALSSHVNAHTVPAKALLLLYEPSFHHAMRAVTEQLQSRLGGERTLLLGAMKTFYSPQSSDDAASTASSAPQHVVIGGQEIDISALVSDSVAPDAAVTAETCAVVYIGAESPHLTSILLRYSALECVSYDPRTQAVRVEGARVNRALMRRYFLVQQAKEAQIIGILMGTLGVAQYLDVVHSLQALIKKYVSLSVTCLLDASSGHS